MASADPVAFFKKKHPWSEYKDLILDYYLAPYLSKVARLGRPIVIVDCFAGAGRFGDGKPGSPLIIAQRVEEARRSGASVRAICIERDPLLAEQLKVELSKVSEHVEARCGDFHQHVGELATLAREHTVFTYVDPIRPSDLLFDDLGSVYSALALGRSVEALVNFLSRGFARRARGLLARESLGLASSVEEWDRLDRMFGGRQWVEALTTFSSSAEQVDELARKYSAQLGRWFEFHLFHGIRKRYRDRQPKYHLVFGSRSSDAVDLMNRAMNKARMKCLGEYSEGMLFDCIPETERSDCHQVERSLMSVVAEADRPITWRRLRVVATCALPGRFTDSDWNRAIKACLRDGRLVSREADGRKVVENALIACGRGNEAERD